MLPHVDVERRQHNKRATKIQTNEINVRKEEDRFANKLPQRAEAPPWENERNTQKIKDDLPTRTKKIYEAQPRSEKE